MPESDPDTDRLAAVDPSPFRGPLTGPFAIPEPTPGANTFDPFNTNTWNFKAPPTPWHRTSRTRTLLLLVLGAAAALVISLVLLATQKEPDDDAPTTRTSPPATTTPSSTAPRTATSTTTKPPPAPPPPAAAPTDGRRP